MSYRSNFAAIYKGVDDKIVDHTIQPYSSILDGLADLSLSDQNGSVLMVFGEALVLSDTADGALVVPSGSTASRPTPTKVGMIRYNETTTSLETYIGSSWQVVATRGSTADATNWLQFQDATAGNSPILVANGTDLNVGITLQPKGTGYVLSPLGYDMSNAPQNAFATKVYVDWEVEQALTVIGDYLPISGGTMTGSLQMATGTRLELPSSPLDAPSIYFEGEPDTGITLYGSNQMAFVADGAPVLHIQGVDEPVGGANHVHIHNAVSGDAPTISVHGPDTDVDLILNSSGSGVVRAADDYSMADGPVEAFATKGYVDTLTALAPLTNQIFVGGHGSDDNSGRTMQQAMLTVQAAITAAGTIATQNNPVKVLLAPGRYQVINPVVISNPFIEIAGHGHTTTLLEPTIAGQPVFEVSSPNQAVGTRFADFRIVGNPSFAGAEGSIGFRYTGEGRYTLDNIGILYCNVGIDLGNSTVTFQKTNFNGFVFYCNRGIVLRTVSELNITAAELTANNVGIDATDNSLVVGGSFICNGNGVTDSIGIRAADSAELRVVGVTFDDFAVGVELRNNTHAAVLNGMWFNNITDISQVNATAEGHFDFGRFDSSKIIAVDPSKVLLFFSDMTDDIVVGQCLSLLRQADGRLFSGDSLKVADMDSGTVGSLNVIDTAAAIRIWQYNTSGTATLQFVHGNQSDASANSSWSLQLTSDDEIQFVQHGSDDAIPFVVGTTEITCAVPVALPAGSALEPALHFGSDITTGMSLIDGDLVLSGGGTVVARLDGSAGGSGLRITSGVDATIGVDGSGDADLVIGAKGTGHVVAPSGYDMSGGTDQSYATKGYVDSEVTSSLISGLQVHQLTGSDMTLSGQILFLADTTRENKVLSIETTGFNFTRSVVSDNAWINLPELSSAASGYIMPYDGTVIRASIFCDDVGAESMDFSLYVDDTEHGEILTLGGSAASQQNENIRIDADFTAGEKLRLRARNGTGTIGAVSAMVWVKWKYTA